MTTYAEPVIRLMTLNLETDGGEDEHGQPPQRWRAAHEAIIAPRRPDVLFRQELTFSHLNGNRRLHAAERILGMRGFLSPTNAGRHPTALFLRSETFHIHEQYEHLTVWRTPPTNIVARLRDVPERNIVMVSWHAAFNSPRGREREAEELTALADKTKRGASFIGAGDCNEPPVPDGGTVRPIDWSSSAVTDRVHVRHRTNKAADGSRVSCTYLDETLLDCGLHDPARYVAHTRGQTSALDATAGHAAAGHGGGQRIDRVYLDGWLVQAVLDVTVVDTTGVSDHHGVEVILARRKMREALRREFDPLPPIDLTA